MTPEQKQQILRKAPARATYYSPETEKYYMLNTIGVACWFLESINKWKRLDGRSLNDVGAVSLDSLREPEKENWSEEDERRMDVIGSNGNDGLVYMTQEERNEALLSKNRSKYHREIKPGVWVDVYDVIVAWSVSNPALQHLIKKCLQPGERGHKDLATDMQDIVVSAVRAQQIEDERVK